MGDAYFYHLTMHPLEQTLPMLLGKARQRGWRICVRGANPRRMALLDEALWKLPDDPFLPHGLSGGDFDAEQPILLTTALVMTNQAQCLMAIEGAEVSPEEVNSLDRVCVLFDGNHPAATEKARTQWRSLTKAGCRAQYWSEESGRWEKKAES